MYDDNNIFAKIIRGEIPCEKVYEDDDVLSSSYLVEVYSWKVKYLFHKRGLLFFIKWAKIRNKIYETL